LPGNGSGSSVGRAFRSGGLAPFGDRLAGYEAPSLT
jgi:hypothetical protein